MNEPGARFETARDMSDEATRGPAGRARRACPSLVAAGRDWRVRARGNGDSPRRTGSQQSGFPVYGSGLAPVGHEPSDPIRPPRLSL